MQKTKTTYAANRTEWRAWLEQHHATEKEVWLVYYKKGTGKPSAWQSGFQRGSPGSRVIVPVLARGTGHGTL